MVLQALSDLYFDTVYYANRNIRRTLPKMELHTYNNLSSMKKVVFGHLLKRPLSLHFFVLSYGGSHVFLSRRIYYTPLFFSCPSTQSVDMEKAETSVQLPNIWQLFFFKFFILAIFVIHLSCSKSQSL